MATATRAPCLLPVSSSISATCRSPSGSGLGIGSGSVSTSSSSCSGCISGVGIRMLAPSMPNVVLAPPLAPPLPLQRRNRGCQQRHWRLRLPPALVRLDHIRVKEIEASVCRQKGSRTHRRLLLETCTLRNGCPVTARGTQPEVRYANLYRHRKCKNSSDQWRATVQCTWACVCRPSFCVGRHSAPLLLRV